MNKGKIFEYIDSKSELFTKLSDKVWDAAELRFTEKVSSELLCKALEDEGFTVERGIGKLDTAFCGHFGSGKPVIAFLGEFDALPRMSQKAGIPYREEAKSGGNGHGCGHNLLGAGALAAAFGVKRYLEECECEGTVIYFGCPGEEGGSGKVFMVREGVFDGVDCALTWHPSDRNEVSATSYLASYTVSYRFRGISAHAAANPESGRSALDALELMNIGVQFLREHISPEARIHYAITDTGGSAPNIVQSTAEAVYQFRAPTGAQAAEIYRRLNKIAEGAALMTETEVDIRFVRASSNTLPNTIMEQMLYENMAALPRPTVPDSEKELMSAISETLPPAENTHWGEVLPYTPSTASKPASTDVGDVSWVCPTAQFDGAVWPANTPMHSWQAVAVGKSETAHRGMIFAGKALAATAIDLFEQPEKFAAAQAEFIRRTAAVPYVCPIPNSVMPDMPK